eukprot:1618421-Rhodomonas_salina.1
MPGTNTACFYYQSWMPGTDVNFFLTTRHGCPVLTKRVHNTTGHEIVVLIACGFVLPDDAKRQRHPRLVPARAWPYGYLPTLALRDV